MDDLIIEDLPEAVYRALLARSANSGRTVEDEIREILENAVLPPQRVKLGLELAKIGRDVGGTNISIQRDLTPDEPIKFE